MAGHSKWANIKYKKMKEDAKRGRIFTRLTREIIVAAREGGGDPETNPRLRAAIAAAKAANMPKENIERAIKRGTGELPGVTYEEITYEGYGPGGVAVIVEAITDNRNRTVSEIRRIFSKHGGSLGETGCVSWLFDKKGVITIKAQDLSEDDVLMVTLEAGAEDLKVEEDTFQVITAPEDFEKVKNTLEREGLPIEEAEVTLVPKNLVKVEGEKAEKVLKLMDALESLDEVQKTYANFEIPEEIMAALGA
ncbi:MAG TPA: YebC/PmpR family DNA-binding transcriptional regulator [Thermosulfidibacter takaii]|uniref:Probable transcriptional regulatory protein ENF32_05145 n=1 Tax=Thermosulfidibacter takaii TaxID=412593 RepID=A0A7C0Y9M8_9BACT|nr:YebC/PmpR family DNA-binding transcriptional regulator [Thermosulfidibacter takaii]